jgi:hypothetical protein
MTHVLLTLEMVEEWREEVRRLTANIAETNQRIAELQKKLAAAQPFITDQNADDGLRDPASKYPIMLGVQLPPASMFDAITRIVRKDGALEPRDIAQAIQNDPSLPDKIRNSHKNYLYTALKRMTDRNLLKRDSQGRYSVPKTNEAA